MGAQSKIEWTDATWNPIRGCSRVSEGCRNCYAERVAARFSGPGKPYEGLAVMKGDGPHWTGKVRLIEEALSLPLRWRKPKRIFVNSMSDLFHESVPDEWIDRIFAVMALCPQHTFQVLTKRPERMLEYSRIPPVLHKCRACDAFFNRNRTTKALTIRCPNCQKDDECEKLEHLWPLPNVWKGASVEDQPTADERIPLLLQTPAAVRWVSYEPALGPVDFRNRQGHDWLGEWVTPAGVRIPRGIDWVVCGGESGPGARPMKPDWARSVRDQCQAAGIPFFFKQWGAFEQGVVEWGNNKKRAGRLLDGREWNDYPEPVHA